MKHKKFLLSVLLYVVLVSLFFNASILRVNAQQLGASLYIAPLLENPKAGSNYTATIKIDSLAQPVNAVKGTLVFNKERIEIINVSKIGSILNLWIEEPRFSNLDGTLKFQGGVPNPGFIGNGGLVLYVIFRAKSTGATSFIWKEGEILANDGKGTNILTDLQNLDFFIEDAFLQQGEREPAPAPVSSPWWADPMVILNIILVIIILVIGFIMLEKWILKSHDKSFHRHSHEEPEAEHTPHTYDRTTNNPPQNFNGETHKKDEWDDHILNNH